MRFIGIGHLADQAKAMTGTSHDFLYRGTVLLTHDEHMVFYSGGLP